MKKRAVSRPAPINLEREAKIIRRLLDRARKRFIADVVEIGKHLAKVKAKVGHGEFLTWLEKNFTMSVATAERAIAVSKLPAKLVKLTNLDLTVAYMVARQPPEVVEEICQRLESGETITPKTFKVIKSPTTERSYTTIVGYPAASSTRSLPPPRVPSLPMPRQSPPSLPSPEPSQPPPELSLRPPEAERFAAATAWLEELVNVLRKAHDTKELDVHLIREIGVALCKLADSVSADAAEPPPVGTRH
jgi:hypothetical protein